MEALNALLFSNTGIAGENTSNHQKASPISVYTRARLNGLSFIQEKSQINP
jgi:hypothetical protein